MKIEIRGFKPRLYQENILATCIKKNTLVVLPTGIGKTFSGLLLAVYYLNKFPSSKILFLAPTRPLSAQIYEVCKKHTNLDPNLIVLLTGNIKPENREQLWNDASIIVGTPQTIHKDIINNRISLENVSLLVIDEVHHSVGKYSYPFIVKRYLKEAKNQRILGLTASPGGTHEKIQEICKNTGIEAVEIRTETDLDVAPYIKKKQIEWIVVELPESFKQIKKLLDEVYTDKLKSLRKLGFLKPTKLITKKDLLSIQANLRVDISKGYKKAFFGISLIAQLIKIEHALSLLETQGVGILEKYWKKLRNDSSKAAKKIINDGKISSAMHLTSNLFKSGSRHPKISKLCSIVNQQLNQKPESKIIIFANFRDSVNEIVSVLEGIKGARPIALIGQKEGLSQKEQVEVIRRFGHGDNNIMITTSIGEEGLSIEAADVAIFYETVASEIRQIQRRGRVGRTRFGKIIVLVTKDTRDEAYKWAAYHKEKKMKRVLYAMKHSDKNKKTNLSDFLN
jgi:Fanconi anemia group M protein